jgi:hypothetical protein
VSVGRSPLPYPPLRPLLPPPNACGYPHLPYTVALAPFCIFTVDQPASLFALYVTFIFFGAFINNSTLHMFPHSIISLSAHSLHRTNLQDRQDLRSFQPPHQHHQHSSHPHLQHHTDHPPEIRLTPSTYSMSYQQGYEHRGAPSGFEQKPPQLEMNHRSHWDRLVRNPGIASIIQEFEFLYVSLLCLLVSGRWLTQLLQDGGDSPYARLYPHRTSEKATLVGCPSRHCAPGLYLLCVGARPAHALIEVCSQHLLL